MFIPTDQIRDWQDLQQRTQQIFSEMDYDAHVSKVVDLAGRGQKEIDVYVSDPNASHNKIYLIECKHWESNVPQEIVHAFKTIMEETGANTGFIVSKRGFQRGAYEAARFTNIKLLSFAELQQTYGGEWSRKLWQKLDTQLARLREIGSRHFDQFMPSAFNNIWFHTPEQHKQVLRFQRWVIDLACWARSPTIESYSHPKKLTIYVDPNDPDNRTDVRYDFVNAREYFSTMTEAARACADSFETFHQQCRDEFDELEGAQQEALMNKVLRSDLEELPLRVLKRHLSEPEYERLLALADPVKRRD